MSRKDETKGEDMESDIIKISHLNKSFSEVNESGKPLVEVAKSNKQK